MVLLLVLVACGKRGDPRPPVPVIPQATSDLVVTQRADRIVLSWSYPALTTAGRTLGALRRIVVYRYSEELPPSATTRPAVPPEPDVAAAVAGFATVPTLSPVQFAKVSERVRSIEGANLADATVGSQLVFTDTPAFQSPTGRPRRITYGVVTEGLTARSPLSNLVSIVPLPVATPPSGLTATPRPEGVVLTWEAPTRSIQGEHDPVIIGYNVYRGEGESRELATPVNQTLVEGTSYTDVPSYGEHQYRVTAVAAAGPPRLESDPSAPVTVKFLDRVPPPAPASISALVETAAVRLVWDAVEAPDLWGYRLYRTEGAGQRTLVEVGQVPLVHTPPTTATNFRDDTVQVGISYRYEVTAVDRTGNESPRVSTGWALVPRTP